VPFSVQLGLQNRNNTGILAPRPFKKIFSQTNRLSGFGIWLGWESSVINPHCPYTEGAADKN